MKQQTDETKKSASNSGPGRKHAVRFMQSFSVHFFARVIPRVSVSQICHLLLRSCPSHGIQTSSSCAQHHFFCSDNANLIFAYHSGSPTQNKLPYGYLLTTLSKPVQPSSLAAYLSHLLSCSAAHPWMQDCTSLLVSQTRTLAAAYLICSEVTQCQIPLGSICMMLTSQQQITELEPIQRASGNCTAGKLLLKDYLNKISILSGSFSWNMERVTPRKSPKGMQEGK